MESLLTATTKYGERMLMKIIVPFRNTFSLICDGPHPDNTALWILGTQCGLIRRVRLLSRRSSIVVEIFRVPFEEHEDEDKQTWHARLSAKI